MGNAFFKEEFKSLNSVVTSLINDNNTFKNPDYRTKMNDVCDKFTVVLESQLNKHMKVELQDLKDSIYLVPHANHVDMPKESGMKKSTLCSLISSHYSKMLEIILLIKYVYDVEHNGDNSIAGMTIRNIRVENKVMEISYCVTDQHFMGSDKIDLNDLNGFTFFTERFLTKMEREKFFQNMRFLFGRKKKGQLAEYLACGDSLISGEDYKDMLRQPKGKCSQERLAKFNSFIKENVANTASPSYKVRVRKNNPVLHYKACAEKRIMLIDLRVKSSKEVVVLFEMMQKDYVKNINTVLSCLLQIVEHSGNGNYVLKNVDTEKLNTVRKELIKNIAKFYFQSLANFHALMDKAKQVPHFTLGENDR